MEEYTIEEVNEILETIPFVEVISDESFEVTIGRMGNNYETDALVDDANTPGTESLESFVRQYIKESIEQDIYDLKQAAAQI